MNTNIYRSCCKYETLRYVLETQFDLTPQFQIIKIADFLVFCYQDSKKGKKKRRQKEKEKTKD